jgi:nucleoside-diphosphate-sugar epimerase
MALKLYAGIFWVLTPICLIVFSASGLYTRGRAYRERYKVLVVIRAVTLSYLIFGFIAFLVPALVSFPRSTLALAWFLTLASTVGARVGSTLWRDTRAKEAYPFALHYAEDEPRNVLVTGGAGYLGSTLTERLLTSGYRVRVLDCLLYGERSIATFYRHPNFELIRGDFCNLDTVVRAIQGVDAVVHLGAIVGDPACALCEDLAVDVNFRATRTLAEVSKGFGITRFIFASTCSVYGASSELLDERSMLRPISLYAQTKLESERVLLGMADAGFSPTILRFATIYGLSYRPRFDLVVNLLTAKAVQERHVGIFGGTQWRPLVHVKDVAGAIVLCLRAPLYNVRGQIFNVGSNEENYQIAELGQILKEMVPAARVVTEPKEDDRNYRVCFDKIHNMLKFQTQYTVRDGIQEIIDAYAGGLIRDYRDLCCSNAAYLRENGHLRRLLSEERAKWDWARVPAALEPIAH